MRHLSHSPALDALRGLTILLVIGWQLGLPLSITVAALSYRYVEQPFLRMKRRSAAHAERHAGRVSAPAPAWSARRARLT